jgi:hypothetical protein
MGATSKAIREYRQWIDYCKAMGWPEKDLAALADIWWKYHDDNGELITPPVEPDPRDQRIAELEAQLSAALRDQRRYQWLRERDSESASDAAPFICVYAGSFIQWNGEAADDAIDSAMEKQT